MLIVYLFANQAMHPPPSVVTGKRKKPKEWRRKDGYTEYDKDYIRDLKKELGAFPNCIVATAPDGDYYDYAKQYGAEMRDQWNRFVS